VKRFKSKEEVKQTVDCYGDMLLKICLSILGNQYDAEEIVQETFIAYMERTKIFKEEEHKKAWLIRVAINKAKNALRYRHNHNYVNLDDVKEVLASEEKQEMLVEIIKLPVKIKTVIHLHYYEGYTCKEIAGIV